MTTKYFWSAKEKTFFPFDLKDAYEDAGTWPDDAVPVNASIYHRVVKARNSGKVIDVNNKGMPIIKNAPDEKIDVIANRKRLEIDASARSEIKSLRESYPDYEQASWDRQAIEANAGGGELIEAIANEQGIEVEQLIASILENSGSYAKLSGAVIGKRKRLHAEIDKLEADGNITKLKSISWTN